MKRKLMSIIVAVTIFALQIHTVTFAEPNFIHTQSDVPTVTGNGIFIEAEDCSYTNWYSSVSNSSASGGYTLKATKAERDSNGSSRRGELEVKFKTEKAATYVVWIRAYAASTSQDSYYVSFEGQGYSNIGFATIGSFEWIKSGNIYLSSGTETTFRVYPRENSHLIDAVIITPTKFVPTGESGNIPEGEYTDVLISKYAPTPYQPPSEHPRVLFRASDIEKIKENMLKPQNSSAYSQYISLVNSNVTGNAGGGYSESILRIIEAKAFSYAIDGNVSNGQRAVNAIIRYLGTADPSVNGGNETRNGGYIMYTASEVYDWCYDLMTDEQREYIIGVCENYAHNTEIKWPPDAQGSIVGHGSEAQLLRDMLAFAIATYDERPDIWESVGGRFYEEYVAARDYFNKGHFNLQGDSYGLYRHRWDTYSYLLITGMGLPSPYNAEDLAQASYGNFYLRRPDGQYLRDGDTTEDVHFAMWKYWSRYAQTYLVDATIIKDPYLKDEAFAMAVDGKACYSSSPIVFLVFNDPDMPKAAISNLPKSRFFDDPAGMMIARTGWDRGVDTNDVVVEMKIGGVRQNNHQHYDAGHFQIYYKGILASDSGVYQGLYSNANFGGTDYNSEHRKNYMLRTIAHNTMLVYDPSDVEDGGQRLAANNSEPARLSTILNNISEYRAATVLAQEIDPKNPITPEYTYIKGDLKSAYSSKVSEFKRSFMFLNLFEEEVPAALIVFDKISSSNKSFKKTWLLHGVEKPTVNGNQTVFSRTYKSTTTPAAYNGKMTVDTLLPKSSDANIEIVGGEEEGFSIVNGIDYTGYPLSSPVDEGNTYRMELSPKSEKVTDYFLNVIQVSDNDKNYYADTEIIESSLFYGAKIRDRAVMFSKSGNSISSSFSVTVPSTYKFTICDAKQGTWRIKSNEGTQSVVVGKGGVLSFTASGTVSCSYISTSGEQIITEAVIGTADECRTLIEGQFVNGKEKPEMKNGTLMMSLSTLADWFEIGTNYNKKTVTLSRGNKVVTIKADSKTAEIDDITVELEEAPYLKNGEMMIPAETFIDEFGGSMTWYPITNTASIWKPQADCKLPDGYATMVGVTYDDGEIDGGNVAEYAIDENPDTIWAANGVGRYFDIDLGRRQEIDQVEILFNPNSNRNAKFDILISNDGTHFVKVLSSTSDGSLENVAWEVFPLDEPVIAKYVRYKGNGSNISDWNAIKEIRFRRYDDGDENPSAENNIQVLYSVTGDNFTNVPFMKDAKTEYEVILPDNSKYVYLKFAVPQGATAPSTVWYSWQAKYAKDWFSGNNKDLLGTADTETGSIDEHVLCQTQIPIKALKNSEVYKVPIKNEHSEVTFIYTDDDATLREYYIDFRAKQPRLTSFTNVLSSSYSGQSAAKVAFVSGAAVNNDNGSIVHSGIKENDKINAMANTSEELLGGSMFMLPARTNGASNLFTFTADHGGKIYVLSDEQITGTGYSSWTCENDGTLPQGMQTGSALTIGRDKNDFAGIYSLSVNWSADENSTAYGSSTKNYYRVESPGVTGDTNSTSVAGSYAMMYAYSKTFSADEAVTVPATGNSSLNTAVVVKWYGDEITGDASYSVNSKGEVIINANGFDADSSIVSAIYGKDGGIKEFISEPYKDGSTSFKLNSNLYKISKQLKLFIWNLETLEAYLYQVHIIK